MTVSLEHQERVLAHQEAIAAQADADPPTDDDYALEDCGADPVDDHPGAFDKVCRYGCARERLIHEMVGWNLTVRGAARDLFAAIAIAKRDDASAELLKHLNELHIALARPLAEESNDHFDLWGPMNGDHYPFNWDEENARASGVSS
jgi:hypothetical protein